MSLTQILWKKYFMSQWENGIKRGNIQFYSNVRPGGGSPFSGNHDPFRNPQEPRRRFDPNVIDVDAQSETVDKKE